MQTEVKLIDGEPRLFRDGMPRPKPALSTRAKGDVQAAVHRAYEERFGELGGYSWDPKKATPLEMKWRSLETGKDLFASERRRQERAGKQYEKERKRRELAPFTAKKETAYTTMVKCRALYEGACDLQWSKYFAFRKANDCDLPLTDLDLLYLSLWTTLPPHYKRKAQAARKRLSKDGRELLKPTMEKPKGFQLSLD